MAPKEPASDQAAEYPQSHARGLSLRAVLKVGGSLGRGQALIELCRVLERLCQRHRLLVIPGGGGGADQVRDYDRRYGLSDSAAHWMAILAMDQYGLLLEDMIGPGRAVKDFGQAAKALEQGLLPILLPHDLLAKQDPLPHSWQVTSDSIAAWAAKTAHARDLVLLKDVDGLFRPEPTRESSPTDGRLLAEINLEELAESAGVDPFLATLMRGNTLGLWIINGEKPGRLAELLTTGWTTGTRLLAPET